jgi:nicotinamide riboside kinase
MRFQEFALSTLERAEVRFEMVGGDWDERFRRSIELVERHWAEALSIS